jgi:hypothetical protein
MFAHARRLLRYAVGTRFIDIEQESPERLELSCGMTRTIFEKATGRVIQHSRTVGKFAAIEVIELHQPRNQEGPLNWFVTIRLTGGRAIEVGQVTDQTDASVVGARISTITGHLVTVKP